MGFPLDGIEGLAESAICRCRKHHMSASEDHAFESSNDPPKDFDGAAGGDS